jgi:hypothetical protein
MPYRKFARSGLEKQGFPERGGEYAWKFGYSSVFEPLEVANLSRISRITKERRSLLWNEVALLPANRGPGGSYGRGLRSPTPDSVSVAGPGSSSAFLTCRLGFITLDSP